jgi:hypothetical protein
VVDRLVGRSIMVRPSRRPRAGRSIDLLSIDRLIDRSIDQSVGRSVGSRADDTVVSIARSINRSIDRPIDRSVPECGALLRGVAFELFNLLIGCCIASRFSRHAFSAPSGWSFFFCFLRTGASSRLTRVAVSLPLSRWRARQAWPTPDDQATPRVRIESNPRLRRRQQQRGPSARPTRGAAVGANRRAPLPTPAAASAVCGHEHHWWRSRPPHPAAAAAAAVVAGRGAPPAPPTRQRRPALGTRGSLMASCTASG